MVGFVKLHGTILDSSVWQESAPTRLVWITMLAMANGDGVVEASIGGLAHRARVTREECEAAIQCFLGPDPDSRDRTTGERIEEVPGGWLILNHRNYRELRTREQELTAARVARHRERQASSRSVTVTERSVTNAPPASASASASEKKTPLDKPQDVTSDQVWQDWKDHRRLKRASVSATAVDKLRKEAAAAGMTLEEAMAYTVAQGHQGFFPRTKGTTGTVPPRLVAMSTQHIPNMPLGAASCECQGCREFRAKRGSQ
jgi:hypothetical protein